MPTTTARIEIAASPAEVRKVFMDFDSYPTWTKTHIQTIGVIKGDKNDIKPGDTLKVVLPGTTFSPVVQVGVALTAFSTAYVEEATSSPHDAEQHPRRVQMAR